MIGADVLLGILSKLLGGSSWKELVRTKGEAAARAFLKGEMQRKLSVAAPVIAAKMEADGWEWTGTNRRMLKTSDEGLGRGFVLSRDALYRLIAALGVPGGLTRDAIRDASDNKVWAMVHGRADYREGMPLSELVAMTAAEWVELVF